MNSDNLPKIFHCWPTVWLEAAQNAGFATFDGTAWIFLSDAMREKLEQFAVEITKSIEKETTQ